MPSGLRTKISTNFRLSLPVICSLGGNGCPQCGQTSFIQATLVFSAHAACADGQRVVVWPHGAFSSLPDGHEDARRHANDHDGHEHHDHNDAAAASHPNP